MGTLRLIPDKNLILTGYTEPNQSRIGRRVAELLGRKFVDVEQEIERQLGDTPDAIRAQYGERRLKAIEKEVMDNLVLYRNSVIRISGSMLANSERQNDLMVTGYTLCLIARLDAVLQRIHISLGSRYHNPSERGVELAQLRREWSVRKIEGVTELDVTYKNEETMINDILQWWQTVAIARG